MSPASEAVAVIMLHRAVATRRAHAARLGAVALLACAGVVPLVRWWSSRLDDEGALTAVTTLLAGSYAVATLPHVRDAAPSARVVLALVAGVAVAVLGGAIDLQLVHGIGAVVAVVASVLLWRGERLSTGVPALLLLLLALPARGDLDAFVGFPLRVVAASGAAAVLSPVLGAVPRETVLVLEGRVADVEVACSGVSTMWVALAAIALVAHEHQRRRRFAQPARTLLLAAMATFLTALLATTVRVALLAAIGLWPGLPAPLRHTVGQLVHVPLGLLALVAAVAVGTVVVRTAKLVDDAPRGEPGTTGEHDRRLTWVLLPAWLVLALIPHVGAPRRSEAVPTTTLMARSTLLAAQATTLLTATEIPLTTSETALFGRHADAAVKVAFNDGGSALLVAARSPTAHHAPERCLASAGHAVVASSDVDGLRVTVLDDGALLAVSFFASAALPADVTLASTPERMWLSAEARLRRVPAPAVVFVSALWPREPLNTSTMLSPTEHHRAQRLRAAVSTLVHTGGP